MNAQSVNEARFKNGANSIDIRVWRICELACARRCGEILRVCGDYIVTWISNKKPETYFSDRMKINI